MTKDEYGDFVLRYKGCGACFPLYHTLSRFEKMWFTAIQKDVEELEKENAELKAQIDELKSNSGYVAYIERGHKIYELEKENEELKERADKADLDSVLFFNKLCKAKEIIETLSKSLFLAKGIIRDLIDDTVDFKESKERAKYCYEQESFDVYKEAEQFLKEVDK